MADDPEREGNSDGRLLRLLCPFCTSEYPLWFRPEGGDEGEDSVVTEWERWLDESCRDCGKAPREHAEIAARYADRPK